MPPGLDPVWFLYRDYRLLTKGAFSSTVSSLVLWLFHVLCFDLVVGKFGNEGAFPARKK